MTRMPSEYSHAIAAALCERIIDGESLRTICRDDAMPGVATVYRWLLTNEAFREQYTRAKEDQADTLADEIIEISDDARNDWMERFGKEDRGWAVNGEHINRSRLRVEARKWCAAKLKPKKYGEKIETTHKGDAANPIHITSTDGNL